MPSAEIITIGTEILLGEIIDTNAAFMARQLRLAGFDLYRKTSVGDNIQRIAQAIQEAIHRCDIIITSGGLGPTVDDPTRDAVALALGRQTEFHAELWEQIQARFRRFEHIPTDNNKRQAFLPQGAVAIENPVGTAPCFSLEVEGKVIISLPGVPHEMEYILQSIVLPYLQSRYPKSGVLSLRVLHTVGTGESQIDALIDDLEKLSNPTVGLAAHSGQIDIRIVAKADTNEAADKLIQPIEKTLYERLQPWIYGKDEENLQEVVLNQLAQKDWKLVVVEFGIGGALIGKLSTSKENTSPEIGFICGESKPLPVNASMLAEEVKAYRQLKQAELGLGVSLKPEGEKYAVELALITPFGKQCYRRPYGGAQKNAPAWAVNQALFILWKLLK